MLDTFDDDIVIICQLIIFPALPLFKDYGNYNFHKKCFSDFWAVYGECENFAILKGHTGAVMELQFSTDGT